MHLLNQLRRDSFLGMAVALFGAIGVLYSFGCTDAGFQQVQSNFHCPSCQKIAGPYNNSTLIQFKGLARCNHCGHTFQTNVCHETWTQPDSPDVEYQQAVAQYNQSVSRLNDIKAGMGLQGFANSLPGSRPLWLHGLNALNGTMLRTQLAEAERQVEVARQRMESARTRAYGS